MGCRLPGNTSPSGFICYNHPIFNMDMSHVRERCNAVIPECRNHPGGCLSDSSDHILGERGNPECAGYGGWEYYAAINDRKQVQAGQRN